MMILRYAILLVLLLSWASVASAVTIIDTCVRANEGPPLSASWGNSWHGTGLIIASNKCVGNSDGNDRGGYWSAATFGPDIDMQVTISTIDENNFFRTVELQARLVNPTNAGTVDGYAARIEPDSGGNGFAARMRLWRIDNGVYTALSDSNNEHTFADGEKYRFTITGSTLEHFYDAGGGWVSIDTATDSTYSASGYVGLATNTGAAKLTMIDFGAETVGGGGGPATFGFLRRRGQ